jgi:hypothetical protein
MGDDVKEELIRKLKDNREYINQLNGMLKRDQRNHDQEIQLADKAKQGANEILFDLTGDEFYKPQEEK